MLWFLIIPLYCSTAVPQINDVIVEYSNETIQPNLATNFSFEEIENKSPTGWKWSKRNTDSQMTVDDSISHTGKRSVKFQNKTPFGAHVYGSMWTEPPIHVKPKTRYTLSFYALSDSPGAAWVGGGAGWNIRIGIQPTDGKWRRFSRTFTTGSDETEFVLRINTDSPTPGFWVDDIKLEEGSSATICKPPENHKGLVLATPWWPSAIPDGPWEGVFEVYSPEKLSVTIETSLFQGDDTFQHSTDTNLSEGLSLIHIKGKAVDPKDDPCELILEISDSGKILARDSLQIRFLSLSNAEKRLEALKKESKELNKIIQRVKEMGIDPAYPLVGVTTVSDFIQYVKADLDHDEIERAFDQLNQMEAIAKNTRKNLESVIAGDVKLPEVPRYVTSPIEIDGSSFVANTRYSADDMEKRRPVFFTGYGHFSQVRSDLEKFPGYGVNIIQIEFGPRSIYPEENQIDDSIIDTYLKDFDRAAKAGVSVCLLISPHYMPQWMMDKYPQLNIEKQGFLRYCLHVPEGQEFLKRYLRYITPKIKDHPALHSICLANEPINPVPPECEYAQRLWHEWLEGQHGNIESLNRLWGANYKNFDEIPIPGGVEPTPLGYEFTIFNQEWFAGWHKMLADVIHESAPDIPIHTKAMTWNFFSDQDQRYGVNAELFAEFSQINGNDSANMYNHGRGEWNQNWQLNNMGHDLQLSVADIPVFNSENHIIRDRDTKYIPSGHIRTALWQAAIHGQGATTIWVWGRTYDPRSDFSGSIMHRPECVEAVGHTGLDLLRLSKQVQSIQNISPRIGLLYSTTAMVYDGGEYTTCQSRLYRALSFTGFKLCFVTERQLANGDGHRPDVLLVPNIKHLSDAAFDALEKYPGKVILMGDVDILRLNEYNKPRGNVPDWDKIQYKQSETDAEALWVKILEKLPEWNLLPLVDVRKPDGSYHWGVEWLAAKYDGKVVVNLIQHGREKQEVHLTYKEKPFAGLNMFNNIKISGKATLKPLEPVILIQDIP
ncbi:hypothetical protein GF312_15040 [Candidatus Poribacteria bacterium]|nr:hypothetical protein [Candidatus Poribacteria bacterium]